MLIHQRLDAIRVVGRDLLPHIYHKADRTKLFCASRKESRALGMMSLPAKYPHQMYAAVAGGEQHEQPGVQPPTYAMQLAVHVSILCIVTVWHTLPSTQCY